MDIPFLDDLKIDMLSLKFDEAEHFEWQFECRSSKIRPFETAVRKPK